MDVSSSVIVVSQKPGSWLAPCLASALPQASEVIVVDNGSAGEEVSAIARDAGAAVVRSSRNRGFAGGVNLGLRRARGELVALLNDDAVAGPGWIDAARTVLDDPTVAAVTPKVLLQGKFAEVVLDDEARFITGDHRPLGRMLRSVTVGDQEVIARVVGAGVHDLEHAVVDGSPTTWRWTSGGPPFYVPLPDTAVHDAAQSTAAPTRRALIRTALTGSALTDDVRVNGEPVDVRAIVTLVNHAGNFLERHGIAGDYGFAAPDDGRFDEPAERFGFSGTAPVFRAETLTRLGGLAAPFFAYNEDTDWCLRARLAGLRIVYDPGATVGHRLSATSGGPASAFVRFLAQRNALLCLVRNAPADVARTFVWRRIREGPGNGVRRAVILKVPWAVASRMRMKRHWVVSPAEVWSRWAGADTTWDTSPSVLRGAGSGTDDPEDEIDEASTGPLQ